MASFSMPGLRFALRALRYRNYRLFFGGQSFSLIGTWMQQLALGWLAYDLTNSAFLLGLIGFAGMIPTLAVSPIAGVFSDRWNRYHILLATQSLAMLQAFLLAVLTLTGAIRYEYIVALAIFLGIVNAFDIPARQSFVVEIVERKEDLGNAIALNSLMFNGARLIGPSIAGVLIGLAGEGTCFLLNALSYAGILAALAAIKVPPRENRPATQVWQGLREGFAYAFGFAPIRYILLQLAVISLMGMPYAVLMPIFARDILMGGPGTLGFLMACSGTGALIGAIYLAARKSILGLGKWIVYGSSLFGCAIIAFSFSRVVWLSAALMVVSGFGMIIQMASSNTILQTIVEEDKRGRVMSFFALAIMGTSPLGSLFAGYMGEKIGVVYTLMISGIICIAGALLFAGRLPEIREKVRPIYRSMGIGRPTDRISSGSTGPES